MNSMTRECYRTIIQQIGEMLDRVAWQDRRIYGLWLAQAYYLVRHTTRLLALCAGYCPIDKEEMHRRLLAHLVEEDSHDKIAAADLTALGYFAHTLPELSSTRDLIQRQYEQLERGSSAAFWGYILLLEGLAVTRGQYVYDQVSSHFGPKTGRFLKLHAEEDIEHIEKALDQVEHFNAEDRELALSNLRESAGLYISMLHQVNESKQDITVNHSNSLQKPLESF